MKRTGGCWCRFRFQPPRAAYVEVSVQPPCTYLQRTCVVLRRLCCQCGLFRSSLVSRIQSGPYMRERWPGHAVSLRVWPVHTQRARRPATAPTTALSCAIRLWSHSFVSEKIPWSHSSTVHSFTDPLALHRARDHVAATRGIELGELLCDILSGVARSSQLRFAMSSTEVRGRGQTERKQYIWVKRVKSNRCRHASSYEVLKRVGCNRFFPASSICTYVVSGLIVVSNPPFSLSVDAHNAPVASLLDRDR